MTSNITMAQCDSMAKRALSLYNDESWQCQFIRHNENLTYKVTDTAGKDYLLRLHWPAVMGFVGPAQDEAAIKSELAWLDAIYNDTGLQLQRPIANAQGNLVTLLRHDGADRPIPVTLMTWVEGEQVTWQEENAAEITVEFAHVVSMFHNHSRNYQTPSGFVRPAYDKEKLASSLAVMAGGVEANIITASDFKQFELASDYIYHIMDELGTGSDVWGLIHSDWIGNLISNGRSVTPIDFSLCGFGHYMLDLAICIYNLNKPLRPVFIKSFSRGLRQEEFRQIEAFTLYIIVVAASRFIFTDLWGDWFTRRFPLIAQKYCTALLENSDFLLEI